MISESIALMTVIDMVIVLTALISVWIMVGHRNTLVQSNLIRGPLMVVVGLLMVGLFYLTDLVIMFGLPLLIPTPTAMAVMEDLHLNYSWITMLAGTGCIFTGFALTNRRLFSLIDRLKRSEESLGRELTERKRAEEENKALARGLETLLEVGRQLSRFQPLQSLLGTIAEACGRLLDSDSVGFRLVEGNELVITGTWGDANEVMPTRRLT